MIKTCPICNRNFESVVANATYCNISCRKKAGREAEKTKRSAFYEPPDARDKRILWQETTPTLHRLWELVNLMDLVAQVIPDDKGINLFGVMPEGWEDVETSFVGVYKQVGMNPDCWSISRKYVAGPIKDVRSKFLVPPVTAKQREIVAAVLDQETQQIEAEIARMEGK